MGCALHLPPLLFFPNRFLSFSFVPFSVFVVASLLVSAISPLNTDVFPRELARHPDQSKVSFVLDGLRNGFKLGFRQSRKLKSATKNKPSANQHSLAIDQYLANEVLLGRVAGPFPSLPVPNLHVSSFGVIPKGGNQVNGGSSWIFFPLGG